MSETRGMREALARVGSRSLGAYFRRRQRATFGEMSAELGVSRETVQRWYRDWVGEEALAESRA